MDQTLVSKIIEKITQASSVLIALPPQASGDDLAAALALRAFLVKLEKDAVVVCSGNPHQKFSFLNQFDKVETKLNITKSFVIDLVTTQAQIDELSYNKEKDKLSIYIKPKTGQFTAADVSFRTSNFPFNIIIVIGSASLDSLGGLYSENAELFFETPIINLDRSPSNENYGQFNLVNLQATSNSEIVYDLINQFESSLIDQPIATALLAGIVFETNSFQHSKTTPAAFMKASKLVDLGANQQEIIGRLYKSKSLNFLKLWGRVLARINQEPGLQLVYSKISTQDIEKSGASEEDIKLVIKEMAVQLSFAKIFFFFQDLGQSTDCYGLSHGPINLSHIFQHYQPQHLSQAIKFHINKPLAEAEADVINQLNQTIG